MSLTTLPSRSADDLGAALTDTRTPAANELAAAHVEAVKDRLIEIGTDLGVDADWTVTGDSVKARVQALEDAGPGGGGPIDAGDVGFTPAGSIVATDVQAALVEIDADRVAVDAALSAHLADATDAHDASAISVVPAGTIASTTVQAALEELDGDRVAVDSALSAHLADGTDAHDASAISVVPAGTIASTTVQAALEELDGDVTGHVGDATAAHEASAIAFTPAGTIAATDVQAAVSEVASDAAAALAAHAGTGGAAHANVIASGASGFMTGADKAKLDGIASSAAAVTSTGIATVGTANAGGASASAARADHVHAHGAQTDGTLHAGATTSVAGFMSAADKTKINGVDDPATYAGEAGLLAQWQYGVLTGLAHGGAGSVLTTDGTATSWDTLANLGAFSPGPWSYLHGFSAANYYESASAPTTGARGSLIAIVRLTDTRDFTEQVIVGFSNQFYASAGAHIGAQGDTVVFSVVDNGGTRRTIQQTGVQAGKWYLFIGTWDGTGANLDMRLITQARQNSSSTAGAAGAITGGSAPLCVGCANGDGTHPATYAHVALAGFLHDVVLDLDDARQIMDLLQQTQTPPIVNGTGTWVFDTLQDPTTDPGAVWDDQAAANTLAEVGAVNHRTVIEGTGTQYSFPILA